MIKIGCFKILEQIEADFSKLVKFGAYWLADLFQLRSKYRIINLAAARSKLIPPTLPRKFSGRSYFLCPIVFGLSVFTLDLGVISKSEKFGFSCQ